MGRTDAGKKAIASHIASLSRGRRIRSPAFRPPGLAGGQGLRSICSTWAGGHVRAAPAGLGGDRRLPALDCLRIIAADAINESSFNINSRE
ncbi:MAG TPA: hypothetical protein PKX20_06305 [Methanothrix soehngenii]|nr:hypothetical protein [Methanothrix soehngenii]